MNPANGTKLLVMDLYFLSAMAAAPVQPQRWGKATSIFNAKPDLIVTTHSAIPLHTLALRRLKDLSGLSTTRLAELLGVERRTVYFWEDEKPISESNERHLDSILDTLDSVGVISPVLMRKALMAIDEKGVSVAEIFRTRNYEAARKRLELVLSNDGQSALGDFSWRHRTFTEVLNIDEDESGEGLPAKVKQGRPIKVGGKVPYRA